MREIWRFLGNLVRWIPGGKGAGRLIGRLMRAGTVGYREDVQRRLMIINCIAYLIGILTFAYVVQYSIADYDTYRPLIWLNAGLTLLAVAVPNMHRFGDAAGGLLVISVEYLALFIITMLLSRDAGSHFHYFIAPAAAFVVFGLGRLRLVLAVVIVAIALLIAAHFMFPPETAWIPVNYDTLDPLFVQTVITIAVLIAASVWYAFRLTERAKAETDALLHNILPTQIVARLKHQPDQLIADSHDSVSVLFTDISGFVALSLEIGPERVVKLLNDIVREFDELSDRYRVEKIKTIGDAYMAVAGVPDDRPDHARRAVLLACDMLDVVTEMRKSHEVRLDMRVGIASGPVITGVIGTNKFSYDVWGDTVNLAARLETNSDVGRILVSEATYRDLADDPDFLFRPAGEIDVKGKGATRAWFVERPG